MVHYITVIKNHDGDGGGGGGGGGGGAGLALVTFNSRRPV